tara:strand:- start:1227 stop:1421 length:195 start_codon:yes stop_codon:yes gene_type:complete
MLKADIQGLIRHNERIKAKFHALDTVDGDKKVVKCERIITQCQQILRAMKAVDVEVDILEEMNR